MVAFNSFCLFHWFYLSFRISFAAFFLSLKREWFVKEMKARARESESKVRGAGGRVGVFSGFQQLSGKFYGFDPGLAAGQPGQRDIPSEGNGISHRLNSKERTYLILKNIVRSWTLKNCNA